MSSFHVDFKEIMAMRFLLLQNKQRVIYLKLICNTWKLEILWLLCLLWLFFYWLHLSRYWTFFFCFVIKFNENNFRFYNWPIFIHFFLHFVIFDIGTSNFNFVWCLHLEGTELIAASSRTSSTSRFFSPKDLFLFVLDLQCPDVRLLVPVNP